MRPSPYRHLAKVQVAGSNPVSRSNPYKCIGSLSQRKIRWSTTKSPPDFALAVESLHRVAVEAIFVQIALCGSKRWSFSKSSLLPVCKRMPKL